ncbi:uncharacterized protein LOC111635942 [Centruroides sculpturatus]|uniref:uncharacterized protein LOC111635942 n=1 Tax=Centruroides sculpturatus TaxID=218467 RepID=UPI000C6E160B|nr:uncharacterized protein LOC111635942 [Centruroides sculpturatus]
MDFSKNIRRTSSCQKIPKQKHSKQNAFTHVMASDSKIQQYAITAKTRAKDFISKVIEKLFVRKSQEEKCPQTNLPNLVSDDDSSVEQITDNKTPTYKSLTSIVKAFDNIIRLKENDLLEDDESVSSFTAQTLFQKIKISKSNVQIEKQVIVEPLRVNHEESIRATLSSEDVSEQPLLFGTQEVISPLNNKADETVTIDNLTTQENQQAEMTNDKNAGTFIDICKRAILELDFSLQLDMKSHTSFDSQEEGKKESDIAAFSKNLSETGRENMKTTSLPQEISKEKQFPEDPDTEFQCNRCIKTTQIFEKLPETYEDKRSEVMGLSKSSLFNQISFFEKPLENNESRYTIVLPESIENLTFPIIRVKSYISKKTCEEWHSVDSLSVERSFTEQNSEITKQCGDDCNVSSVVCRSKDDLIEPVLPPSRIMKKK